MTSQNPASPNSQRDRDLLAKVNAHADRSLDRLFADIDELLSGDLTPDANPNAQKHPPKQLRAANLDPDDLQQQPPSYSSSDFDSSRLPSANESLPALSPRRRKRIPTWLTTILGIGVTSLAIGGGLYWLVSERKIELPQNIDTSWVPFQSKSSVSSADANFATYLQKSLAKIEAANPAPSTTTTAPAATAPTANPALATTTQPAPIAAVQVPATTPVVTVPAPLVALLKTLPASSKPSAVFKIDDRDRQFIIGQKIGTSDWSLLTVNRTGITIKNSSGEIRAVKIGQKF